MGGQGDGTSTPTGSEETSASPAHDFDVLVIGGGINGCGIARDAVGRGYSVCLAEMNDIASGTSSWSSKLIHGGLRYLEHYEFMLVRKSLGEREVLLNMAPHIIRPMRFVLPQRAGMRSGLLLRLGLFLYDRLGKRKLLDGTRDLKLRDDEAGRPLKPDYTKGYEYSDCHVADTRLVVLNAVDAAARGADVNVRTRVVSAERAADGWDVVLADERSGERRNVSARLLVNAGGPWVDDIITDITRRNDTRNVRLVAGSHIVTRKLFDHDRAYIVQNDDGRIVFLIPYEGMTMIGTTDRNYEGDPGHALITDEETDYLLEVANEYLAEPISRSDIAWTFCGVRPLYDDGATEAKEATRDYVLETDSGDRTAPLVNIFGGKLTTYRTLAEAVLEHIEAAIGAKGKPWTGKPGDERALPGGDFPPLDFEARLTEFHSAYGFLDFAHARRLFRCYGTRAAELLGDATTVKDLGHHFGADLFAVEVDYLVEHEFATSAQDILWRRTKCGLHFDAAGVEALERYVGLQGEPAFFPAVSEAAE